MKDRIRLILEKKSISSANFADKIGVQRSNISHILSGRNKPSLDFLQKLIIAYPDINTEWLISGNGNMLKDDIKLNENLNGETHEKPINSGLFDVNAKVTNVNSTKSIKNDEKNIDYPLVKEIRKDKRKLIRIVNFYNDHTFDEFFPNE